MSEGQGCRQAPAAASLGLSGELGGGTLHPGPVWSLSHSAVLAGACDNCRTILRPVDITEKLYNCLKCQCIYTKNIENVQRLNCSAFWSSFQVFFSEGFNSEQCVSRWKAVLLDGWRGALRMAGRATSHTFLCTKSFSSEPYFTISLYVLPN